MRFSKVWFWRFCAVNAPLVATALLSLSLLFILILVITKGMAHFVVKPVYEITTPTLTKPVLAMLEAEDKSHISISWFDSDNVELQRTKLENSSVQRALIPSTFVLKTRQGMLIFAQGIQLGDAAFSKTHWQTLLETNTEVATQISRLHAKMKPLEVRFAQYTRQGIPQTAPVFARLVNELHRYHDQLQTLQQIHRENFVRVDLDHGKEIQISVSEIALIWQPNQMSLGDKIWFSMGEIWRFITSDHSASSGSAGIFPALFGTVLMVFLMTVLVMPVGVLTAIYLHEYAPHNHFVSIVRVIIINLAGIPSIVYGVFGLGFFILGLGVQIDQLFYAQNLPSPTFGTPGILWASITMALLTLPTVIVATEEGLQQVPQSLRNGALALGATKYEAIRFNVLPMASPNILTGAILSIARAASEVAPLLLVGAVIYAPTLPVDDTFPYIHLERQFMHLGVLIFDSVFHTADSFNNQSMMYAICLLLIIVVLSLNSLAAVLRAKLRRRYERYS